MSGFARRKATVFTENGIFFAMAPGGADGVSDKRGAPGRTVLSPRCQLLAASSAPRTSTTEKGANAVAQEGRLGVCDSVFEHAIRASEHHIAAGPSSIEITRAISSVFNPSAAALRT